MYTLLPATMVLFMPFLFMANPSLIFLWVILEMSSIMFICMGLSEEEVKKKECFLVYFLIQSFASAFLLVCLFSWTLLSKSMVLENPNNMNLMIAVLISLKVAMGPMHFWLIKMSKLISWFLMGTLLTWQKIIPLSFFSTFSMNAFIPIICIISLMVGTLSQLKLTSLKMMMAYSSVSHLGWMVMPLLKSSMTTLSYMVIYSLIVLPMMTLIFFSNYQYLFNQVEYTMMICLSMLILSLSGIPPLLGFMLKWLTLTFMWPSIMMMLTFSLMACLSFYIYIRMVYKSFLLSPLSFYCTKPHKNSKWIWATNLFMPIFPLLW